MNGLPNRKARKYAGSAILDQDRAQDFPQDFHGASLPCASGKYSSIEKDCETVKAPCAGVPAAMRRGQARQCAGARGIHPSCCETSRAFAADRNRVAILALAKVPGERPDTFGQHHSSQEFSMSLLPWRSAGNPPTPRPQPPGPSPVPDPPPPAPGPFPMPDPARQPPQPPAPPPAEIPDVPTPSEAPPIDPPPQPAPLPMNAAA
jgi:hypothetical protein